MCCQNLHSTTRTFHISSNFWYRLIQIEHLLRIGYPHSMPWFVMSLPLHITYDWPYIEMFLVGGLEHFYFSIYWESSSQLTFIFFRGVETTNQMFLLWFDMVLLCFTMALLWFYYGCCGPDIEICVSSSPFKPHVQSQGTLWMICTPSSNLPPAQQHRAALVYPK